MPAPIPREAPVTMATFPARAFMVVTPLLCSFAVRGSPSPGTRGRRWPGSADPLAEEFGGAVPQLAGEVRVERLGVVAPGRLVLLVVRCRTASPCRGWSRRARPSGLRPSAGGHEGAADAAAVDASQEAAGGRLRARKIQADRECGSRTGHRQLICHAHLADGRPVHLPNLAGLGNGEVAARGRCWRGCGS